VCGSSACLRAAESAMRSVIALASLVYHVRVALVHVAQ
jgi:hypothetical protein